MHIVPISLMHAYRPQHCICFWVCTDFPPFFHFSIFPFFHFSIHPTVAQQMANVLASVNRQGEGEHMQHGAWAGCLCHFFPHATYAKKNKVRDLRFFPHSTYAFLWVLACAPQARRQGLCVKGCPLPPVRGKRPETNSDRGNVLSGKGLWQRLHLPVCCIVLLVPIFCSFTHFSPSPPPPLISPHFPPFFPILLHFPPFPPIPPIFLHFPPFPPIFPHFPPYFHFSHFSEPLRLVGQFGCG